MAPIFKPLALASALLAAISSAAPVDLNKRENDVVWTTVTTVVWTTVDVTTTIYPTPQAPTPTPPVVESTPTATPTPEQPKPIEASTQPETSEVQPAPVAVPTPVAAAAAAAAPSPEEPAPQPPAPAAPSTSTTSQAPQSTAPAASSGNSGSTDKAPSTGYSGSCSKDSPCVGQLTYYDTATSASAPSSCGLTNDGFTENVVALPVGMMTDADCGKTVTITYNGITKSGTVVDKCMGCKPTDVDMSRHFFGELADLGAGRLQGASWYIN